MPIRPLDYKMIAKSCNSSEQAVLYSLKQLGMAIETSMKINYTIKLNLRIGWLKFSETTVFFDNLASNSNRAGNASNRGDNITITSANTDFLVNKYLMTDFRSPQAKTTT